MEEGQGRHPQGWTMAAQWVVHPVLKHSRFAWVAGKQFDASYDRNQ